MKDLLNTILKYDKVLHFIINFVGVIVISYYINIVFATIIMVIISVLKEFYDVIKPKPTGFSINDLIADVIGMTIGIFVYMLIHVNMCIN